jgi:hypothetical protein
MLKRSLVLISVSIAAIALLGATGCTKKKMMGSLERSAQQVHQAG